MLWRTTLRTWCQIWKNKLMNITKARYTTYTYRKLKHIQELNSQPTGLKSFFSWSWKSKSNPKQIINRWAYHLQELRSKFTKQNKKFNRNLYFKVFSTNTSNKNISRSMSQAKICMVGAFATGKTSLVARFVKSLTLISIIQPWAWRLTKKSLGQEGGNSFCGICTEKTNFKTLGFLLTWLIGLYFGSGWNPPLYARLFFLQQG